MKRAVLYARVSGDDRLRDNRNLNGQLDMCREHAVNKGWKIVAELSEDEKGASGYMLDLPELERIFGMAERSAFDILVVREMDRLSRNVVKQMRIEEILGDSGVQIEYVIEDYPDTPEGQLLKNVRAVIAEYEREKILERVTRGKRLAVKDGNVLTCGPGPYGYRIKEINGKRSLTIHHEEAKIVNKIFNLCLSGPEDRKPMSTSAIARRLDSLGVPTRSQAKKHVRKKHRVSKNWGGTKHSHDPEKRNLRRCLALRKGPHDKRGPQYKERCYEVTSCDCACNHRKRAVGSRSSAKSAC